MTVKETTIIKKIGNRTDTLRYHVEDNNVRLHISSYNDSITLTIDELKDIVKHAKGI